MKGIIVYATKYGCTEKAVKLLQSKLPQAIKTVNVVREKAPDLSSFDTVILGGPIYVGKMHGALSAYMRENHEVLKKKRLALFVCAGEQDPTLSEKQFAAAFPEELYNRAIVREALGGELYWEKLDPMTKLILRVVKGLKAGYARLSEAKIEKLARGVFAA
ncbi:MAG: flavodoxin domain-containing protein [Bacteroidota bacterium]